MIPKYLELSLRTDILTCLFTPKMLIYRSKSVPPKMRHSSLHLQTLDWNADDELRNYQNAFVTQEITRRKGESEASQW